MTNDRETREIETAARFDERVENYVAYRPRYPRGVVELLRDEAGLAPGMAVADVGAGTGFLSELFLQNGNTVVGVEPNDKMRAAAEVLLGHYPNFCSVKGTAEATTLDDASVDLVAAGQAFHWFDDASVDLVAAGQAFHWFDAAGARAEFARILRPGGRVALVWNMRRLDATPFLRDYEELLREFGTDYTQVNCEQVSEDRIAEFFGGAFASASFDNFQSVDFAGLRGRLLSSSYVPLAGHPGYEPMLAALRRVFDSHRRDGRVRIEYDTKVYYGELRRAPRN